MGGFADHRLQPVSSMQTGVSILTCTQPQVKIIATHIVVKMLRIFLCFISQTLISNRQTACRPNSLLASLISPIGSFSRVNKASLVIYGLIPSSTYNFKPLISSAIRDTFNSNFRNPLIESKAKFMNKKYDCTFLFFGSATHVRISSSKTPN